MVLLVETSGHAAAIKRSRRIAAVRSLEGETR